MKPIILFFKAPKMAGSRPIREMALFFKATFKNKPGYILRQGPKGKKRWMKIVLGQRLDLFDLPPIPIIEAPSRFKNLAEAQQFALKQLGREPARNEDTEWDIHFGYKNLSKLFSASSTRNSAMPEHLQVAAVLRDLIRVAVLAESHRDRRDTGETGQSNVLAMHRLYAPVWIEDRLFRVKLTVKEHAHPPGRNFKNYQLAEIEMPARELVNEDRQRITPASRHSAPNKLERTLSISQLLRGAIRDSDGQPFRS